MNAKASKTSLCLSFVLSALGVLALTTVASASSTTTLDFDKHASATCGITGAKRVASSGRLVVVTTSKDVRACIGSRRPYVLDRFDGVDDTCHLREAHATSGRYTAIDVRCTLTGLDIVSDRLASFDVARRHVFRGKPYEAFEDVRPGFVLATNGAFAFILDAEVIATDGSAPRQGRTLDEALDAGAIGDLRVSGNTVSWRHGSERRSARLEARNRSSKCKRLRGKDLAPDKWVKLVRKRNENRGTDLLGCVLPRGPVYRVASDEDFETRSSGYDIRQVQGAIVLVDVSDSSQYGSSRRTLVKSLSTGSDYEIASSCSELAIGYCGSREENTAADAARINAEGQAAAAIVPVGGGTTTIAGFSSSGTRIDFDSGPSDQVPWSSLQLHGSTVTWTHSGEARSEDLSVPTSGMEFE